MIVVSVQTPFGTRPFHLDPAASPKTIMPYIADAMGMAEGDALELVYDGETLNPDMSLEAQGLGTGEHWLILLATGNAV